ncbi:MAG: hypothetical protein ACO1OB_26080 [Archangium sp.]
MFFVSDDVPPTEKKSPELAFCLPPQRSVKSPPPLPVMPECEVSLSITSTMTLKPVGEEWVVTLESTPMADVPALQVKDGKEVGGSVHDLRWHGSAGIAKRTRTSWKQKPGRA